MAELKIPVAQLNEIMGNTSTKLQYFEMWLDVMKIKVDETEKQNISTYKDVSKHELEFSAKMLRIQNLPHEKDGNLYTLLAELLAPVLNLIPHELILELDHTYRQHTTFTRKAKLPPKIFVKFIRRFMHDSILLFCNKVCNKELNFKVTKSAF